MSGPSNGRRSTQPRRRPRPRPACGSSSASSAVTTHRPPPAWPATWLGMTRLITVGPNGVVIPTWRRSPSTSPIHCGSRGGSVRRTCWSARSRKFGGGPTSSGAFPGRDLVSHPRLGGPRHRRRPRPRAGPSLSATSPPSTPPGPSRGWRSGSNLPVPRNLCRQSFSSKIQDATSRRSTTQKNWKRHLKNSVTALDRRRRRSVFYWKRYR